ncbi:MAG TPA: DUF5916 domain-containing protein, partial [Gemmatimonadaceae bacterium]
MALILATGTVVRAQAPGPRKATATLTKSAPVIDGRLDDAAWRDAPALTGFVQRELHEGDPITERTEVRLLTDGEALYIGAWLHDREPSGIVPGEKIRDVALDNSDAFAMILDTYLDHQNGFVFATTPAGIEYDGQVAKAGEGGGITVSGQTRATSDAVGGFNLNWNGSWTVATSRDSAGWYAEFRIPFSTLRYGAGAAQTWGINFERQIRRKNEDALWSFVPRQFTIYRLSRAGTVDVPSIPVRHLATVTPYVLGGVQRDFTQTAHTNTTEWGVDARLGVTAGLNADLTYNTDFAQVEADDQRTNLTRFSLFFPETRPFVLENAGVFTAGTPQAVDLFFSRRIGIDTLGRAVPIIAGGRLTGRVGDVTVGAMEIATDNEAGIQDKQAYSVARVSREVGSRSRYGAIAIMRNDLDSTASRNSTYVLDGRLGLGEAWTVDGWGGLTNTPNRNGDDYGFSVRANYSTSNWNHTARVIRLGNDFNPELAFLNRAPGYNYYELALMRLVRDPDLKWLKVWNPHSSYKVYVRPDGYTMSSQLHLDMTEVEFSDGAKFGPEANVYHEGLSKPFKIASNVTLPIGSYTFTTWGLDWQNNPSAPFSFLLRSDVGPFYNGTRAGGTVTFTYREGATLSSSLLLDYNDVRLDQGKFIREVIGTRIAYFFTPRVTLSTLMQYNKEARIWTANTRFAWLGTAGTGLFVVWNDGETADGYFSWQQPQTRSLVVKYARQFGTGGS